MESSTFITEDPKLCAAAITDVLEAMVDSDTPTMSPKQLKRYGMSDDPIDLPLSVFMENMLEVCTPTEALCGLLYVRRLLKAPMSFADTKSFASLTRYNVHRIMFTGVVLANIQWNDIPFSAGAWARWSTVWSRSSVQNMKTLFLKGVDWRLHIEASDFDAAVAELETVSKSLHELETVSNSLQ
eukprot:Rmarinus@m.7311